jgi:hypothetical protein
MPSWIYDLPAWLLALSSVLVLEFLSLGGLLLARRYLVPHLRLHYGVNELVMPGLAPRPMKNACYTAGSGRP